ncbi:MAG: low molecular weight phosphotyrosine protein phosphatase [Phycisphaerae bacterium]|nr:low molecular weight phosphotyrosine protein phosphatase [Phycisphaerae bacterium]
MPTGVLFVCLGNICRSPIAEGVFLHLARERNLVDQVRVESAGIGGWHVGEPPDRRAQAASQRRGIQLLSRAKQVDAARYFDPARGGFDRLIAMDRANRDALLRLGAPRDRLHLLRAFDPRLADAPDHLLDVPDPYYGGDEGFDEVFTMIRDACDGLLRDLFPEAAQQSSNFPRRARE